MSVGTVGPGRRRAAAQARRERRQEREAGGSAGAGGSGPGPLIGACQNGSGYYCVEYSGPSQQQAALKQSCELTQQTWQATCSSANLIGTCTAQYAALNGVTSVTRYYPGSPATLAQLKEACEVGSQGTWATP